MTIKELAEEAGCSVRTVSRVINGSGPVKGRTRERIQELMKKYRYEPNVHAQKLRTQRHHTVGLITTAVDSEVNRDRVNRLSGLLSSAGYSLLLRQASDAQDEINQVNNMKPHCDALVVFTQLREDVKSPYGDLADQDFPFILVDPSFETQHPHVTINRQNGYRQAVEALARQGKRRIALLLETFRQADRKAGYRTGLAQAGLDENPDLILQTQPAYEGGLTSAGIVSTLFRTNTLDAVICHNDRMAMGLMQGLHQRGIKVPSEIAIVGFDNESFSAYTTPALSTIEQGRDTVSAFLLDQLLNRLDHKQTLESTSIDTSFIQRESTVG